MDSFNNNDPFKQFVKSKLADYKKEVPPSGWENLESSLFAAKKTNVLHTRWLASTLTAVAAALIGVFFILQNTNNELPIQTAEYQTTPLATPTKNKKEKALITKQNRTKAEESATTLFADNTSSARKKVSTLIKPSKVKESSLNISTDTFPEDENAEQASSSKELSKESSRYDNIDEETKQQMIQDFINDGKGSFKDVDETVVTRNKSKVAISLSGRSGLSSSQQSYSLPTTLRASLSESYSSYTMQKMKAYNDEVEVTPESEVTHRQPVSFGILTSIELTQKLQLETGITYTYLSSETINKSDDFRNSEKVQFNYLGIPLNLNYTVLSVNKLNLFVTAGAMIEKDISGTIKYNDEKKNSLFNSEYVNEKSSKINQKNPQFSLAGGVGMTYPIYNKAKLFGKVGGRYYINANNEYKTYYSDEKFGLDIQVGIKFNF